MGLPEVFYGLNHFYVANQEHNILLDFNAIDSLSFSGYDKRKDFLNPEGGVNYFEEEKKEGAEDAKEAEEPVAEIAASLAKLVLEQSGL